MRDWVAVQQTSDAPLAAFRGEIVQNLIFDTLLTAIDLDNDYNLNASCTDTNESLFKLNKLWFFVPFDTT